MAQTAVEFYHSKIKSIMGNWTPMMIEIFEETFEQVKQMENAQRIKDYNAGYVDAQLNHINDAVNYVYESEYLKSRIDEIDNEIKAKQNNIANMLINGELNK